jgi:hypothetical protein
VREVDRVEILQKYIRQGQEQEIYKHKQNSSTWVKYPRNVELKLGIKKRKKNSIIG